MLLGDVLARLDDDETTLEFLVSLGDLGLLTSMRQQAAAEGSALAAYTRALVQRYAANASDEEWVTVMGAIGRAPDPGLAFVKRAFEASRPK